MASAVVSCRKPGWRPSSVGIGSSLTLSGSKPSPYLEKECSIAIPAKPFFFPKVGSSEKRAKSAPKIIDCWKNPQTSAKLLLTYCPMSRTECMDDEHTDVASLTVDSPDFQKWAKKSEYYRNAGVLVGQKEQPSDADKEFMMELDDVRQRIRQSPEHIILSIKAVMADKKKRVVTARAAQFNGHSSSTSTKDMSAKRTQQQHEVSTDLSRHVDTGTFAIRNKLEACESDGGPKSTALTYHEILKAAIDNNCSGSSSVNAFVNPTELPSYSNDRDNSSRQTSSSSSTSVALERKGYSRTSQHPTNKQTRHKTNGLTHSHDRHTSSDTLPVVYTDENANSTLQGLTLSSTRQSRTQTSMQSTSNHKAHPTTSSKTQRINSLSISGIKQDGSSLNPKVEDTTTEDEDCRPVQQAVNERTTSKPTPPTLQLYTNTSQPNGATSQSYGLPSRRKPVKSQHSSGKAAHSKQKADPEPKYADPIAGSATSFQARLAELSSLEAETVRWERLRKLKKKSRDD